MLDLQGCGQIQVHLVGLEHQQTLSNNLMHVGETMMDDGRHPHATPCSSVTKFANKSPKISPIPPMTALA